MKRALVLSGGGSRGAYECGAWQALSELNIQFDAIYGTSIGAINAALVTQGNLEAAVEIWSTINMKMIAAKEDGEEIKVDRMLKNKRDMIPFLVENAKNLRLDITPLEQLLNDKLDEKAIRASGKQLGMMLTGIKPYTAHPVRLEEIPEGQLVDYLLASASCFPVFPMREIDGKRYIDGGFMDNMPIGMAVEDGMEEVVAIDIHPQPVHMEYAYLPFVRMIHPFRELGNFLDFDQEMLQRSRRIGYYDTLKSYGYLDGIHYAFQRINESEVSESARRFMNRVARFDTMANEKKDEDTLVNALIGEIPGRQLSWKDIQLRGMELCFDIMEFREDMVYDYLERTTLLLNYIRECEFDLSHAHVAFKQIGRPLMVFITRAAMEDETFIASNIKKLSDHPRETAAALYLLTMNEFVK